MTGTGTRLLAELERPRDVDIFVREPLYVRQEVRTGEPVLRPGGTITDPVVRLAAWRRVAERDGTDAAHARGVNDRDAEIRRWAETLRAAAATPTQEGLF